MNELTTKQKIQNLITKLRAGKIADTDTLHITDEDAELALLEIVEEERKEAEAQGYNGGWAQNVRNNLCWEHEHDVRWCDECSGIKNQSQEEA